MLLLSPMVRHVPGTFVNKRVVRGVIAGVIVEWRHVVSVLASHTIVDGLLDGLDQDTILPVGLSIHVFITAHFLRLIEEVDLLLSLENAD